MNYATFPGSQNVKISYMRIAYFPCPQFLLPPQLVQESDNFIDMLLPITSGKQQGFHNPEV